MLQRAHHLITEAGKKINLTEKEIEKLLQADAEHEFEISLKNGKKYKAYRVQHSNKQGPYKGGIRFHPEIDFDEVKALATLMSLKTAAIGLPLGGGKGGIIVDPHALSLAELEELSRGYVRHLEPHIGPNKDVPAPDVNTNATIIDWMVDEYERLSGDTSKASFTGKSLENAGSLGREQATGRGGVIALAELLKIKKRDEPLTVALQGFGNVGSYFAKTAEQDFPDWRIVAASDSRGGLYKAEGLNIQRLVDFKQDKKEFKEYTQPAVSHLSNDELIKLDVDVLVLAALGDVVTEKNAHTIQAHYVIELANGPVNEKALTILAEQGITVLPDIIANAGGVIVSYLEWLQNRQSIQWDEEEVNKKLHEYMTRAVKEISEIASLYSVNLTDAAFILALKRLRS